MSTVSTEKMMAQIACKAIDDKKGQDIKVIDIHNVSVIADEENRLFYDLERIWRDGKVLEMDAFLEK